MRFADHDLGRVDVVVVAPGVGDHEDVIGQDILSQFRCSATVADHALVQDHPDIFFASGASEVMDGSGAEVETQMAMMRGPNLLHHTFADSLVALVDLSGANGSLERRMDLILGWPIIKQASWIFDHRLRVGAVRDAAR